MTARAAITCSRSAVFQSPAGGRPLDLGDDQLDDPVEQVVLAPDVAVERHRVDPELLAELAHAQRLEAVAIGELDGDAEDAVAVERRSAFGAVDAGLIHQLISHLTSVRVGAMFTA